MLNGASSSGKTSIGHALLPLLVDPWFLVPVDVISAMRSTDHSRLLSDLEIAEVLKRTRRGYHRVVAALASTGNNVIMDYPLSEPWRLADLLKVLEGFDVTLVEIRCSPDELNRRELAREDRPIGLARSQTTVFAHGESDIVVDTTNTDAATCAVTVTQALDTIQLPKAFDRLRQS